MSQPLPDDVRATRHAYDQALEDAYAQLNADHEHMAGLHGAAYESAEHAASKRFDEAVQPSREAYAAAVEAQNRAAEQAGQ